ncbi:hypothetical protein [Candidatus Phytoplasma tritici]|uniref:hypothetical protein n=1 Tax=Candidatus Phytoplasma tritici TaxID=321961 RepID=UPI00040BD9F0|nr:hypothetical protein [Candidatus Phytoplasma tritici]
MKRLKNNKELEIRDKIEQQQQHQTPLLKYPSITHYKSYGKIIDYIVKNITNTQVI